MIATLVSNDDLANWNGDARLFKLDDPFDGWHHAVVERFAEDTCVYPAHPNGGAVRHPDGGLAPWRRYPAPCDHAQALLEMGYEVRGV